MVHYVRFMAPLILRSTAGGGGRELATVEALGGEREGVKKEWVRIYRKLYYRHAL